MKPTTEQSPRQIPRILLYGLFAIFVAVQVFEPISLNVLSKNGKLPFNYAVSSVFDAIFRIIIALPIIYKAQGSIRHVFRSCEGWVSIKLFAVRFMIQAGEICGTLAIAKLCGSIVAVINQARIPLVGIFSYFLLCQKLSRDQMIYAISIVPLAIQFNLLAAKDSESEEKNEWMGYLLAIAGVLFLAVSNVLVEGLLKRDFNHLSVWDNQLLFSAFDLPVMILLYFIVTYIDEQPLNPLAECNIQNLHWIFIFGINGAIWGFTRLSILAYQDAMWLNLTGVLVIGLIWCAEQIEESIEGGSQETLKSLVIKGLCILTFSCILVGYELNTRDREKKEEQCSSDIDLAPVESKNVIV